MPELHETIMGKKLIEVTLPNIAEQLKRIADLLESQSSTSTTTVSIDKELYPWHSTETNNIDE